ncbi:hypothetical protein [Thalassotalea fusca]
MSRLVKFSAAILLIGFGCYFYVLVNNESHLVNQYSTPKNIEGIQNNFNQEVKPISFKTSSSDSLHPEITETREIKEIKHHRLEIVSCGQEYELPKSKLETFFDKLKNSPIIEEQLYYAMASQLEEHNERAVLLRTYNQQNTPSKLSNWALLIACQSANVCDEKTESDIIATDKTNAALWLNVAALRLKNIDSNGVVEALENASNAPEFNDYFVEQIHFNNNVLIHHSDLSVRERLIQATGSNIMKGFFAIHSFCKQSISEKGENAHVCLSIGEKLEKNSKTEIGTMIGLNLQKIAFSYLKDDQYLQETSEKIKLIHERIRSDEYQKTLALIQYDESLFQHWLDNLTLFNAIDSTQNIVNEAMFRSQNEYYNPCS